MWPDPKETADLVTFTEEILNGKLHFCAVPMETFPSKEYMNKTIKTKRFFTQKQSSRGVL